MTTLKDLNNTELVEACRAAGLGAVERIVAPAALHSVLEGVEDPSAFPCHLEGKRKMMEAHIEKNWRRLRTQLPGCNGKCVSFGCPNLIVQRCWKGFSGDIL